MIGKTGCRMIVLIYFWNSLVSAHTAQIKSETTSSQSVTRVQPSLKSFGSIKRLDPRSANFKKEVMGIRYWEYTLIPLQLPGSSKPSDYYVRRINNTLVLNGDIVIYNFNTQKALSYTRDDETHIGKNDLYRWPGGIVPVVLEDSVFHRNNYITIKAALDYFNFNTGIIFKERTNEEDYLVITCIPDDKTGRGGFTAVGRQRNGSNILSLVEGKFNSNTVLHELMHTLGLFHEQARTDRDNFVTIVWKNIIPENAKDFQIEDNGTIRSPYDSCSIMQYSSKAFAIDKSKPTIVYKSNSGIAECHELAGAIGLSDQDRTGLDRFYGELGISRFPCKVPFVSSKLPVAGCIGVADTDIRNKWNFYHSQLGDCQTGVISMGIFNSTYVQFERGRIYHSPHGVQVVYGDIYQLFASTGGIGTYGLPLKDESDISDADQGIASWQKSGFTRISPFEKGVIIWGQQKKAKALTDYQFAAGPYPLTKESAKETNKHGEVKSLFKTTTTEDPVQKR